MRLLFRDGAVLEQDSTQSDAGELSEIVSGRREGEIRRWSDLSWITFAEDRIEAITFQPHPDLGWPLTAEARKRQREAGHPHGVLLTLHEFWESRDEPSFSTNALSVLTMLAETQPPDVIGRFSTTLTGENGAARAATLLEEAEGRLESVGRRESGDAPPPDIAESPRPQDGGTDHHPSDQPDAGPLGEQAGNPHVEQPGTHGDPDPDSDPR
jgi:hypothetical protein